MKQIGIISDTHGCWDERYTRHLADCDEIWHCGDVGTADVLDHLRLLAHVVRAVPGNIDGWDIRNEYPEINLFECEGVRVWMKHIVGYPGRWAPGVKKMLADEKPDLVVAGHSHILKVMYDKQMGLLYINPGAAGRQGWQTVRTLIRLKLDNGIPSDCQIIELSK